MVTWDLINLEVERVLIARWDTPCNLGAYLFLCPINQVKLIVVLNADDELVWHVLDTSWNISVRKVSLGERHYQFKCAFDWVSFELTKEHAVVTAKADLAFSRSHNDVENGVYLERFCLEYLFHGINFYNIYVAKMLSKNKEFFFDTVVLVFEELDIVNTLLQLFIIFLFESIYIKNEKVAIVTTDPCKIIMHTATKQAVSWSLLHNDCAQLLVVNMHFVTFTSRKYQPWVICSAWRNEGASPVDNWLTTLHLSLSPQSLRQFCICKFWNCYLLRSSPRSFRRSTKDEITVATFGLGLAPHVGQGSGWATRFVWVGAFYFLNFV